MQSRDAAVERESMIERIGPFLYRAGLHGATMDEIAREAGTYKMSIYRAIGTKNDVWMTYAQKLCEQRNREMTGLLLCSDQRPERLVMNYFLQQRELALNDAILGDPILKLSTEAAGRFGELHQVLCRQRDLDLARFEQIGGSIAPDDGVNLGIELYMMWQVLVSCGRSRTAIARDSEHVIRMVRRTLDACQRRPAAARSLTNFKRC